MGLQTINKFKKGTYNVLVASSIGEEGLDIGEIDLIVCYEANKSPIRMVSELPVGRVELRPRMTCLLCHTRGRSQLQRVGRTGRARDGRIIVLMTEGREEKNWSKAQDAYNDVQNALVSNKVFELYADGDRMMPKDVKPACKKVETKALKLNLDLITMNGYERLSRRNTAEERKAAAKKDKKPPKLLPADAFSGFRTAGALAVAMKGERDAKQSPAQVMRERKAAALLTAEQEQALADKWQHSGGAAIVADVFEHARLLFDRAASGSTHKFPNHSSRHNQLVSTLQATFAVDESLGEDHFDVWHAGMSAAFNPKLVNMWDPKQREGRPKVPHQRLSKPKPEMPVSSMTLNSSANYECPLPTYLPPRIKTEVEPLSSSSPALVPTPPLALSSSPPRDQLPDPVSKATAKLIERTRPKPVPKANQFSRALQMRNELPSLASERQSPPRPRSQIVCQVVPTNSQRALDPYGMLSSDDDLDARARPKPSTDFDLDGLDLDVSDSELLAGAVVRGAGSASCSPAQSAGILKLRTGESITIDTDTEEELDRDGAVQPMRGTGVLRPSTAGPALIESPTRAVPDSDPASQHVLQLPPSSSQPQRDHNGDLEDEFSFFDLPEEAMEAAFDVPAEAIRGRREGVPEVLELADSSQPVDDSVLMPPPMLSRGKVGGARLQQQEVAYKPRPRHHIIPDSSSSSARPSQPRGSLPQQSPLAAVRGKAFAPFKQPLFNLPTSSPPVAVARARKGAPVVPPTDTPEASAPVMLNRIRRGRQVVEIDNEEEEEVACGPARKKAKVDDKGARRKRKLTAKAAHRTRLFDVEAVNSDVDGSEASSEDYASENSDDRRVRRAPRFSGSGYTRWGLTMLELRGCSSWLARRRRRTTTRLPKRPFTARASCHKPRPSS